MFIDYITLLLGNMTAAMAVLCAFFCRGLCAPDSRAYAPPLAASGLVAVLVGMHMSLNWPVPAPLVWANVCFGETSVLLGTVLLAAALALGMRWRLHMVALYAAFPAALAVVLGVAIAIHRLTVNPPMTACAFIISGFAGLLALPAVAWPKAAALRWLTAIAFAAATALWALTMYMSYWAHIDRLAPKPV